MEFKEKKMHILIWGVGGLRKQVFISVLENFIFLDPFPEEMKLTPSRLSVCTCWSFLKNRVCHLISAKPESDVTF